MDCHNITNAFNHFICLSFILFSGWSDSDQHLRPCNASQHQVQQRRKLQEVLWLCHRPPQVMTSITFIESHNISSSSNDFIDIFMILQSLVPSMSSLHIWFSKLKWSLDVLLRFYERHAFICALHKVTSNISNAFL